MLSFILSIPGILTEQPATAALRRAGPNLRGRLLAAFEPRGRFGLMLLALGGAGIVALYCEVLRQCGLPDGSVAVALAIFVAALTSGIAGFAFSGICGALLFHLMHGPVEIVRLMMACSIANQTMGVWAVRRALHWPSLRPFLLGGLVGVPLGVYLLTHADPRIYERVIGLMLIAYCSWMLIRKPVVVRQTTTLGDLLVGSVAGVAGGFAGLAGVPTAIRAAMKGWDKDRQRALYQPLILILQVLALALVQGSRPLWAHGAGLGAQALFYLPGSLLGTWWGLTIFKRLSDRQFAISLNLLLILSGVTLAV